MVKVTFIFANATSGELDRWTGACDPELIGDKLCDVLADQWRLGDGDSIHVEVDENPIRYSVGQVVLSDYGAHRVVETREENGVQTAVSFMFDGQLVWADVHLVEPMPQAGEGA